MYLDDVNFKWSQVVVDIAILTDSDSSCSKIILVVETIFFARWAQSSEMNLFDPHITFQGFKFLIQFTPRGMWIKRGLFGRTNYSFTASMRRVLLNREIE